MLVLSKMPLYYRAAMIVSLGGLLWGFDTGTIGPVTTMVAYTKTFGPLSSTLHGVVVSAILLGGSFAAIFSGNIADIYGRVKTIQLGALIFGVGAALEASSFKLGQFIAGRIVAGMGEGLFLGTCVVYICEIAPARRRGPLASVLQFLIVVGIAMGYFLSYATARISQSSLSWRLPLVFHSAVSFAFAALTFSLPPSPRWLLAKGQRDEAVATLERLGLASSELEEMTSASSTEDASPVQTSLLKSIHHTFRDMGKVFAKDARKQTALACFIMAMQQFSGIDGVLYYAPLLFQQAGLASQEASFLASGVSALVMLAVTIPASIYSDHWGRRTSVITGGTVLAACMLLIGSLYAGHAVHGDHGIGRWVVIVTIYVFAVAFSVTWAICIKLYSSEIQPPSTRASGTNLAQSVNWIANWTVAFTTPILLARSTFAAYYFFGFATLATVIACAVLMPETKGRSLEAINHAFSERPERSFSLSALRKRKRRVQQEDGIELQPVVSHEQSVSLR